MATASDRAVPGEPTFMQQTYMTMDKRCWQVKRPTAVLTQKPQHGSVRMLTRKATAVYGPGAYQHCDGKVGKALAFEYTSAPDYRGRDSFEVRVRYSDARSAMAAMRLMSAETKAFSSEVGTGSREENATG